MSGLTSASTMDRVDPPAYLSFGLVFSSPSSHRVLHVAKKVHVFRSRWEGLSHVDAATQSLSKPLSALQRADYLAGRVGGVLHPSVNRFAATALSGVGPSLKLRLSLGTLIWRIRSNV